MLSALFAGDPILQAVLDDTDRISSTQHRTSEATRLVQEALLVWDPSCLPSFGADGDYGPPGSETGEAVMRFKRDELGVPPEQIFNDVGPRTVQRLDEIAATREHGIDLAFAVIAQPDLDEGQSSAIADAIVGAGGALLLTLGERIAVAAGDPVVQGAVQAGVGDLIMGTVSPTAPAVPPGIDEPTAELLFDWLSTFEPARLLEELRGWAEGAPLNRLGPCVRVDA
jgi:hypothetical protein